MITSPWAVAVLAVGIPWVGLFLFATIGERWARPRPRPSACPDEVEAP